MKARMLAMLILPVALTLLTFAAAAQGPEPPDPRNLPVTPTPTVPAWPAHVPYDPFRHLETLPQYPSEPRPSGLRPQALLTKPTGIDLDVTYISRTPMYKRYEVWYTADGKPYLRPGTEDDKRWPDYGEVVTFTAHIINKGTIASGSFAFQWLIDDVAVYSGTHPSLAPGEEGTATYRWE